MRLKGSKIANIFTGGKDTFGINVGGKNIIYEPLHKGTKLVTDVKNQAIEASPTMSQVRDPIGQFMVEGSNVVPVRKSRGINENNPEYKNRVNYVTDFLKNNKLETIDDLNVLITNLRDTQSNPLLNASIKEGGFPPFEGNISRMGTHIRNAIEHSDLSTEMKNTYSNQVSSVLKEKAQKGLGEPSKEAAYQNYVSNLWNMKPLLEAGESFISAFDKVVGTKKNTRSYFRKQRWDSYSDRLKTDHPELFEYYAPRIKTISEIKDVTQRPELVKKQDYETFKYARDFTLEKQPEAYKVLKMFRNATKKDNPGLYAINQRLKFLQGHPAGDIVGKEGFISSVENLASKYEMIPPDLVNKIRYPNYLQTPKMNTIQSYIELGRKGEGGGFLDAIIERWDILGHKFTPFGKDKAGGKWDYTDPGTLSEGQLGRLRELEAKIKNDIKEMEKWGIEVQFYHPVKKDIVSWGKKDYGWRQLVQEFEKGKRKDGGYIQSSLASVDEVLNGI